MVARDYRSVCFRYRGGPCMLYNGNAYGQTGFGLAIAGLGE
jgi:hypothetical protein